MKKSIALLLTAAMSVGMLTACGSGGAESQKSSQTAPTTSASSEASSVAASSEQSSEASGSSASAEGKVTFEFWHSMSGASGEALTGLVNQFNESQDTYYCEPIYQGSYYEVTAKIQAAMAANDAPAMAQMECMRICMFEEDGVLVDLTDYIEATPEIEFDDFQEGFLADCVFDDGIWAVPFNRSTPVFYYNADMLKENNLEVPTTWEELHEVAKALSIENERWGFETPIDTWFYEAMIMQSGTPMFNEDNTTIAYNNEAGTAPLYFWKEMIADGSMKTPPGQEYNSWEAARTDFAAGTSAMILNSTGSLKSLIDACDFEVGTAFLPAKERYGVPTGGANLMMVAGVPKEQSDGAFALITFLSNPEIAAQVSMATGYVPVKKAVVDTQAWKDYIAEVPAAQVAVEQMQYTDIPRPIIPEYNEIHTVVVMNAIQKCILEDNYTPEQCVADIQAQVEDLLK